MIAGIGTRPRSSRQRAPFPQSDKAAVAFYKGLIAHGISEADIVQMSQTNPAKLLGLKP